ncbi:cysteine desulfurase family protein [Peribacillus deserti]|uniref:cysteine desulfurase n=1 Tax=Peribacillus deserti TaxID=673318 RepID=A0A2N5M9A4_9BACI|nr:cysteine desulfurase family protein [Peribacillus deserti]PLT30893.1 cysteine desulfurase NifS [Peribacillus deserti]
MEKIYLDHAATSPMHPDVIEKYAQAMKNTFGNPSSIHSFGREARHILDESRAAVARSINATENEIIFTSGGTEADNLAIMGIVQANSHKGRHIISTVIEHHAVLHSCQSLEKQGYEVTYLPVNSDGRIAIEDFQRELRDDTILVTIMYGNNEVGTIQPIKEIAGLLKDHQAAFHTDAVQAYGMEKIDVKEMDIDLLSVSAHKINGPKGIGFLYAKDGIKLAPYSFGGEQERKRRAGTENVPGIAAFAEAVRISQSTAEEKRKKYEDFKRTLSQILDEEDVKFAINGSEEYALPHVLNISFEGTQVEAMLVNLDLAGVAVSSGSACTAGSIDPSHVLVAMFGKESDRPKNSIRFSFGFTNTDEEIERAARETAKIIKKLTAKVIS